MPSNTKTEYFVTSKLYVVGNEDRTQWLEVGIGNADEPLNGLNDMSFDEDHIVTRFSRATFFSSLKEAKARVKPDVASDFYGKDKEGRAMFKFSQNCKVFVVPFRLRDVREPAAKKRKPATKAAKVKALKTKKGAK